MGNVTLGGALNSPFARLLILALLLIVSMTLFMTWDVKASWSFTFSFRGKKLLTLILVGAAIALATLLFQTMSQNRILTPGIMGFDSLYILIQSVLVFSFGVTGFATINPYVKWTIETAFMIGSMILLYSILFRGTTKSLHLLMLSGIILGVFFSSLTALVIRVLDPQQFTVLQDSLFASFGSVSPTLLRISWVVLSACFIILWKLHSEFDVMLLGEETAKSLGVNFAARTKIILLLVAVLVSLSTALVGPVSFFGLLVVHLAYQMAGSYKHKFLLPFSVMLGMLTLVTGEFLLQHIFSFNTRLSIIIEFVGGLFFLLLIIRQGRT
jgi:iron complex transport system permease protein